MADGINSAISISEFQALHIIRSLDLTYFHRKNSTETHFKYIADVQELNIEVRYDKNEYELIIAGSLQKYYHGDNAGDFYFDEILQAIESLEEIFKTDSVEIFPNGNIKAIEQIKLE